MIRLKEPRLLNDEELAAYRRDGFVVVENLLSAEEVASLQTRLREYSHGGRSREKLRVWIEPRVERGEMSGKDPQVKAAKGEYLDDPDAVSGVGGGCIEDDWLMTPEGFERLGSLPQKLFVI